MVEEKKCELNSERNDWMHETIEEKQKKEVEEVVKWSKILTYC